MNGSTNWDKREKSNFNTKMLMIFCNREQIIISPDGSNSVAIGGMCCNHGKRKQQKTLKMTDYDHPLWKIHHGLNFNHYT